MPHVHSGTIGVLTPFVGGGYFGGVLAGIVGAAKRAGGQVIAMQTTDAGSACEDLRDPPDFRHQVAWEHLSGFVIVVNAVDRRYLQSIRRHGKPVVLIGHEVAGFRCPTVLSDNRSGVREAVDHLIEHGHRRIAFAGFRVPRDVCERYEAYRETLIGHGIEPDPALCFDTGSNQESGGERAGRAMLAAGLPCTGVVAGNDVNAFGIVQALRAAGIRVPQDQAVVGFDDIEASAYLRPGISSVAQQIEMLGENAATLLLAELAGEPVPHTRHYVPSSLVVRASCGCAGTMSLLGPDPLGAAGADQAPVGRLEARLAGTIGAERLGPAAARATLSDAVAAIVDAVRTAMGSATVEAVDALRGPLTSLYRLNPRPETIVEIVRHVRGYARDVVAARTAEDGARYRVEDCVHEVILALAQVQAGRLFDSSDYFKATVDAQYEVSVDLLRSHEEDPRGLGWLDRTTARGGCLGLWAPGRVDHGRAARGPRSELDIAGMYVRDGVDGSAASRARGLGPAVKRPEFSGDTAERPDQPMAPRSCTPSAFPPAELLGLADGAVEDIVTVVPLKVGNRDWGLLAVAGPVEDRMTTGRETANQWAALLTVALEHEAVLKSLREQEDRLRTVALYDHLTGLPNRVLFLDRLEQAVTRTRRNAESHFAVLYLDLDGFKVVNDSLGHTAGDQLLVEVANRISRCLRDTDTAARLGGDEFAILVAWIDGLDATDAIAQRLRRELAAPFHLDGQDVVVSASVGITLSANGYENAQDILRDADIAMYSAKAQEKGTHAVFDVAMRARAVSRMRVEADLRRAIDGHELRLHYQPIVDLGTGRVSAFEALIRWQHPDQGLIAPGEFLPVAEESGLLLPIGRWVLAEACQQLRAWRESETTAAGLRLSLNVSNRQFWHAGLLDDVHEALAAAGLGPDSLVLEITEGVIMHNVDVARSMLSELHEHGFELHIDDFGTGYSSLEALHQLPIDALKIDRSFVAGLGVDAKRGELVRTIVLMGANFGLDLIAEGVENAGQQSRLRELGCRYGQGFWFSRPVPADLAGALISRPLPTERERDAAGDRALAPLGTDPSLGLAR